MNRTDTDLDDPSAVVEPADVDDELELDAILRRERVITPFTRVLLGLLLVGISSLAGVAVQQTQ